MTTPAIAYEPAGGKGRFIARDGDALAGELVVSRVNDGLLIIEHTEVAPSHAGTGLGKRLVAEAVAWARAEGQQFLPLCPFARAIFDRTPEYGDVRSGG